MKIKLIVAIAAAVSLSGCASIVKGGNQKIAFDTGDVTGANCVVTGGSKFAVNQSIVTPGTLKLPRSKKALEVSCSKPGYATATKSVKGEIEPWIFGNIITLGFLGLGIDAATGSVHKYPDSAISVDMTPG